MRYSKRWHTKQYLTSMNPSFLNRKNCLVLLTSANTSIFPELLLSHGKLVYTTWIHSKLDHVLSQKHTVSALCFQKVLYISLILYPYLGRSENSCLRTWKAVPAKQYKQYQDGLTQNEPVSWMNLKHKPNWLIAKNLHMFTCTIWRNC